MNEPRKYPVVNKGEKTIAISFVSREGVAQSEVDIPLVLDLDLYNEVIGIEALNFCSFGGPHVLADFDYSASGLAGMRLSYDGEVDALALKIDEGRSIRQRSVKGKVFLDSDGRMTGIEANLS